MNDHERTLLPSRVRRVTVLGLSAFAATALIYFVAIKKHVAPTSLATAEPASAPVVKKPARTAAVEQRPRLTPLSAEKRILKIARRDLVQALAIQNQEMRQQKLARALQAVESGLGAHYDLLAMDLLPLKIRVLVEQGSLDALQQTIAQLYAEYERRFGDEAYDKWITDRVERFRDPRNIQVAAMHLTKALENAPESKKAQGAVLLGDIWVQEGHETGSYSKAIEQYASVAQQYKTERKDHADMASFRQAKALWWSGQNEAAKAIFEELGRSGDRSVMELAEHYLELSDIKYPPTQGQ